MKMDQNERQSRARMETAKAESEKKAFSGPRRYQLYDKIKQNVSLRTVDTIIIVTSLLIVGLLVYGIITGTPQQ